jgi:hypothetical protein
MVTRSHIDALRARLLEHAAPDNPHDGFALYAKLRDLAARAPLAPALLPCRAEAYAVLRGATSALALDVHDACVAAMRAWAARHGPTTTPADVLASVFYGPHVPPERRGMPGDPAHPDAAIPRDELDAWLAATD